MSEVEIPPTQIVPVSTDETAAAEPEPTPEPTPAAEEPVAADAGAEKPNADAESQAKVDQVPVVAVVAVAAPTPVVVVQADAANSMDYVAFQNLAAVQNLEFKQGNVFWEAVSGGCAANTYMIKDRPTDTALFIMEENSSCWMRWCCEPAQPALVKFHNVLFGGDIPEKKCCGMLCQPASKRYNKAGPAVMTMEKPGLCSNMAQCGNRNCFVCMACCQSEAWMHTGDVYVDLCSFFGSN
jgi:hypothetical protein